MIRHIEWYHGAALARLMRSEGSSAVSCRLHTRYRSAYVLDDCVAIYLKYSTNRLSPWAFAFRPEHQDEIASLREDCEEVFVTLICGSDGIACLSDGEYQLVCDPPARRTESLRVSRARRQKYAISYADSARVLRIADSEYPAKVLAAIRKAGGSTAAT